MTNMNIWVAASDGDLERVEHLIQQQGFSPNAKDDNTYTPMHAAASYGHIHLLHYLIQNGGDVNVTDLDGDTPLYAVENIQTARFLLDNGASLDIRNNDGLSPIDHLSDEFPAVAAYLQTRLPHPQPSNDVTSTSTQSPRTTIIPQSHTLPSQHAQHLASDALTSELIQTVQSIMSHAEQTNSEPDEDALRIAVARSVLQGVAAGIEFSSTQSDNPSATHATEESQTGQTRPVDGDGGDQKRTRMGQ